MHSIHPITVFLNLPPFSTSHGVALSELRATKFWFGYVRITTLDKNKHTFLIKSVKCKNIMHLSWKYRHNCSTLLGYASGWTQPYDVLATPMLQLHPPIHHPHLPWIPPISGASSGKLSPVLQWVISNGHNVEKRSSDWYPFWPCIRKFDRFGNGDEYWHSEREAPMMTDMRDCVENNTLFTDF